MRDSLPPGAELKCWFSEVGCPLSTQSNNMMPAGNRRSLTPDVGPLGDRLWEAGDSQRRLERAIRAVLAPFVPVTGAARSFPGTGLALPAPSFHNSPSRSFDC